MISLQAIAGAVRQSFAMQVRRRTDEERVAAIKLAQQLAQDAARQAELARRMEALDEKMNGGWRARAAQVEQQQLDEMAAQIMRRQAKYS